MEALCCVISFLNIEIIIIEGLNNFGSKVWLLELGGTIGRVSNSSLFVSLVDNLICVVDLLVECL